MATITIEISNKQEEALLTSFIEKMRLKVLQKSEENISNENILSDEESFLLLKINEGLPEATQEKYSILNQKSVSKTLTNKEHQELLEIIPIVEQQQVERLKYIIQLANIWNMTVDEVMGKLEIQIPPVVYA